MAITDGNSNPQFVAATPMASNNQILLFNNIVASSDGVAYSNTNPMPVARVGDNNFVVTVTINSGNNLSTAGNVKGTLCSVIMPSVWTASDLYFQSSVDGVNYYNVVTDAGLPLGITGTPNTMITIRNLDWFRGMPYLKVYCKSSAGANVNQVASANITFVAIP